MDHTSKVPTSFPGFSPTHPYGAREPGNEVGNFFPFFNLFQLSTLVSSISQLPEWSCFLFCAIRLLLCVCFLTCLCRLIRECDMTLKWTLIASKTVSQHNVKMIQHWSTQKNERFRKLSFLVSDTQATSIFKNRVFSKTFVCTNFPFWQILVCTQAQNGKDGRSFKQQHISENVLKGNARFSPPCLVLLIAIIARQNHNFLKNKYVSRAAYNYNSKDDLWKTVRPNCNPF